MKKFKVEITDSATYEVEAENEEDAIDIACEWFDERIPTCCIEEIKSEKNEKNA